MKHLFFIIVVMTFFSCKSLKQLSDEVVPLFDAIYFEKWVAGVRGGGTGIHFYVIFKTPLPADIQLQKVDFKGKEAVFSTQDGLHYTANIITKKGGNFNTGENENNETLPESNAAKLYFSVKGKLEVHTLENVKEKEMLAYPSMNKPR